MGIRWSIYTRAYTPACSTTHSLVRENTGTDVSAFTTAHTRANIGAYARANAGAYTEAYTGANVWTYCRVDTRAYTRTDVRAYTGVPLKPYDSAHYQVRMTHKTATKVKGEVTLNAWAISYHVL